MIIIKVILQLSLILYLGDTVYLVYRIDLVVSKWRLLSLYLTQSPVHDQFCSLKGFVLIQLYLR